MNKIITTDETNIELDPESLTDNIDVSKAIFQNKNKMLEAIRDLDNILDGNVNIEENFSHTSKEGLSKNDCFIKVKSKNTFHEFCMNFKLVGLNQGIIERNCSEIEIEASEKKLIEFFTFYQNNILTKKKSKKVSKNNFNQLKLLLRKTSQKNRTKRRRLITKNDVYVVKLIAKFNGKQINLIDYNEGLWRISEMKYMHENNRSTCRVSLTRTH